MDTQTATTAQASIPASIPGFKPGQPGQVIFNPGTLPSGWDAWGEKRRSYFSRLDLCSGKGSIDYGIDDQEDLAYIAEETIDTAMAKYDCKIEMVDRPSLEGDFTVKITWD